MNRPRMGSVTAMTALVLGVTTACSDDPVSQNPASLSVAQGANLASSGGLAGPNDRVPKRNIGLTQAPECLAGVVDMPPGATITVDGLGIGTHKFQCCIHPWMRA